MATNDETENLLNDFERYITTNTRFHSGDLYQHSLWTVWYVSNNREIIGKIRNFFQDMINQGNDTIDFLKICNIAALLHDIGKGGDNVTSFFDKQGHEVTGANYIRQNSYRLNMGKIDIKKIFNDYKCNKLEQIYITCIVAGHYTIGHVRIKAQNERYIDDLDKQAEDVLEYIKDVINSLSYGYAFYGNRYRFRTLVIGCIIIGVADALASRRPNISGQEQVIETITSIYHVPNETHRSEDSIYNYFGYGNWLVSFCGRVKDKLSQTHALNIGLTNLLNNQGLTITENSCVFKEDTSLNEIVINNTNRLEYDDNTRLSQYICTRGSDSYFLDTQIRGWINSHPHLYNYNTVGQVVSSNLSPKTKTWLKGYLDGMYMGKPFNEPEMIDVEIVNELSSYKLDRNIRLFRGLHFNILDLDLLKTLCLIKDNRKDFYFDTTNNYPNSWTWNYFIAENFAKLGSFNFVISKEFSPDDVLVDLRLIPEYCSYRGNTPGGLQDEVILKANTYTGCRIVKESIPNDISKLLIPENMAALETFKNFLNNNRTNLETTVYDPVRRKNVNKENIIPSIFNSGSYGKRMGGLVATFLKDGVEFSYKIGYDDLKKKYTLKYVFIVSKTDAIGINKMISLMGELKNNNIQVTPNNNADCSKYVNLGDRLCVGCDRIYLPQRYVVMNYPNIFESPRLQDIIDLCIRLIKTLYSPVVLN